MSRIFIKITIALAFVCLAITAEQPYKKIVHNTDPKAKCLDGSSPALYFHQGEEKNKILIYFQGGGYCQGTSMSTVLESCYARSKTQFGSSKSLPAELTGEGYLSTDPNVSKFAGWTKILIPYCDGAMHQGSADSIKYKDTELFFRGADNVRSHLAWLTTNYGLVNAESVILTGTSAGGVAAYLWSNYMKSILANPRGLFTVVDSGAFVNVASPQSGMFKMESHLQNLYKIANAGQKTPLTICNRFLVGSEYKCLIMQYAWTSLEGSILIVNSQYDSWAIRNIIDMTCLTDGSSGKTLSKCNSSQIANIEVYRRSYLTFLSQFVQFSKNGVWSISCSTHGYAVSNNFYNVDVQKVPQSTGVTVKSAIERFVLEGQRITQVDQEAWPSNSACAN